MLADGEETVAEEATFFDIPATEATLISVLVIFFDGEGSGEEEIGVIREGLGVGSKTGVVVLVFKTEELGVGLGIGEGLGVEDGD